MASIDKIYGTLEQYDEFLAWVTENKPEYLKYFYESRFDIPASESRPITNFSKEADVWIADHCQMMWAIDRIIEQYGIEISMTEKYWMALYEPMASIRGETTTGQQVDIIPEGDHWKVEFNQTPIRETFKGRLLALIWITENA